VTGVTSTLDVVVTGETRLELGLELLVAEAAVTGQIVVDTAIVLVTTVVL